MHKDRLLSLAKAFSTESMQLYLQLACEDFTPSDGTFNPKNDAFSDAKIIGTIEFSGSTDTLTVISMKLHGNVHEQHRKSQFDEVKHFASSSNTDAVLAVFYDTIGRARVSLVHPRYAGAKRTWNNWRRDTFYIDPSLPNKTFVQQLQNCQYGSLSEIREAFSVTKVSEEFYKEFIGHFNQLEKSVMGTGSLSCKQEFALLLVIRLIFIAFIQKKGWLGDDQKFLQHFKKEYLESGNNDDFYKDWLSILLFDSLSRPIGSYIDSDMISPETKKKLQMAPYLNGGLFERIDGVDSQSLDIPDKPVLDFLDFLFSYNITVQENELYDEELELNPEFLGIIFERYINKDGGAVYTPRTEVDFMCRMSLLKWLQGVLPEGSNIQTRDLYELFFREGGTDTEFNDDQKQGSFSERQKSTITETLSTVTICDPAVGSGAFPVGMLHVLDEILTTLGGSSYQVDRYDRKKKIIEKTLYGMEIQKWAVWICYLRLWLTLFIDAPDDLKNSFDPILPSLEFKILQGDSIVQTIGSHLMPIDGHIATSTAIKTQITKLKQLKSDYFNNRTSSQIKPSMIRNQEIQLTRNIILQEHQEKIQNLASLRQKTLIIQESLLGDESIITQQAITDAEEKAFLEDIAESELMLDELSNKPKAIWAISFAEVFADKGGFDIIIGNPPYVRHEEIVDLSGTFKDPKDYKKKLGEVISQDYWPTAKDFNTFKKRSGYNAKSDLYLYFYFHTLKLLNQNGVQTFICSNSWLDVGYGAWLQKFLLDKVQVYAIYDNHAKRSFASADVNTIISVFSAPGRRPNSPYKFVAFKKSFDEAIITENLLAIEQAKTIHKQDAFRVYPVLPQRLLAEGTEDNKYIGDKWGGRYLRAPDVLLNLMDRPYWKLNSVFNKERYLNTGGADGFFIITEFEDCGEFYSIHNSKHINGEKPYHGMIEQKYFRPLVKNKLKKDRKITVEGSDAICFVVEDTSGLSPAANSYIKWGEQNQYNQKSVTKLTNPWYKPTRQMLAGGSIVVPRSYGDTFISYYNPEKILTLRYYRLHSKISSEDKLAMFMNSTLYWLYSNALGNQNQGQGVLDINMEDLIEQYKFPVINLDGLSYSSSLFHHKVRDIFTECGIDPKLEDPIEKQEPKPLPDRAALDTIIFDELGLSSEERKDVYRAVCRLVYNRLAKADSV